MEPWIEIIIIIATSTALAISIASMYIATRFHRLFRSFEASFKSKTLRSKKRKKRYLVFRIYRLDSNPSFEELDLCIREALKEGIGLLGMAETGVKLIRYNSTSGFGVLRIVSSYIERTIFSISRMRLCNNKKLLLIPLVLTGTLEKAYKKIQDYEKKYSSF